MPKSPRTLTRTQITSIRAKTDMNVIDWVHMSSLPTYAERWFLSARDEAFKADFYSAKVGCVVVCKNHVVGRGHNEVKTDPMQKLYNQNYRAWTNGEESSATCGHTIHAEIAALKSIPYTVDSRSLRRRKTFEVYIYRVAPGLPNYAGLALPCEACAHALQDFGIRTVYYTTGRVEKPFGVCSL